MNIGGAVSGELNIVNTRQAEMMENMVIAKAEQVELVVDNKKEEKVDLESFQGLLDNVNKEMEPYDTELEFSVHEKTKQVMIKVVNTSTKETIREIPSEKLMDIMANLLEVSGILVDIKA